MEKREKVDFNFTMNFKTGEFEAMNEDQKKQFFNDYLSQINCVLMGAILAAKDNLDFILKINADLAGFVQLPDAMDKMRKSKKMIISIVFVGTGEGVLFN